MRRSTNNSEVKKINRNRVFRYINEQKETCMTEIASALEMSGPTVLSLVNELRDSGMIEEVGEYKSESNCFGKRDSLCAWTGYHEKSYCYCIYRPDTAGFEL